MIKRFFTAVILICCVLQSASFADEGKSYYLIGNSLTWDTVPTKLDGDVQYHVDCGKSLPFMFANPEMPCVKSSSLWPKALKDKQYDLISFQTHYGATLAEDVETITKWIEMQPKATVIIHTGWAHEIKREEEYTSKNIDETMVHSPVYVQALLKQLKEKYPNKEFRQTHAIDILAQIAADIKANNAPYQAMKELYRDKIHMTHTGGRYLMHNVMRHALGQPFSSTGFEKVPEKEKAYLDGVLGTLKK